MNGMTNAIETKMVSRVDGILVRLFLLLIYFRITNNITPESDRSKKVFINFIFR